MVHGSFSQGTEVPYIEMSVFSGKKVLHAVFVLDTGFSGYVKIDQQTADEFGIVPMGKVDAVNANGERVRVGLANGYAELEGRKMLVEILIFDGACLAGVGLFSVFGYKVVVDCKNRTAHLELAT